MNIKHNLFFLCLLTFSVSSLELNEENTKSDIQEVTLNVKIDKLLNDTDAVRTSDFVKFTQNINELNKLQSQFTQDQNCHYHFLIAYQNGLKGEVKESILQFQDIKKECNNLSIVLQVESLLANMYAISGSYQQALTSLDNSLTLIESPVSNKLKILVYSTAYVVYDLVNQNQLSHDFAQIIIDTSEEPKQVCSASVYKYISLIKLNQVANHKDDIKNVINECRELGENLYAEGLNVNWIDHQFKQAATQKATEEVYKLLMSSNDSIMATQYKNIIVFKDSLLARILERLGEKEEAVKYAKRALEGTITLGNSQQKIDALKVLYNYYESMGDYQQANTYLLEKNLTEIKYYSDKQEKLMAYQTIKHDSLAKLHQIKTLNQQNEVLMLEKELAVKSKANQLLLTYLFGSLVILLLYIGYRIRKQQKIYKSLSEMDYMTKIYNRKGMKDYMEYMLPYSEKKKEVIAFSIFDLDLFKKINDEYGHTVGDWVIKATVEACKQLEHDKATFARLGGEEFAIIMRDSSLEDIKGFAEKCRSAIYSIETNYETGHRFNISASFGITTTEISGYDLTQLLKDADEALYQSKENGRNQVTTFSPDSD